MRLTIPSSKSGGGFTRIYNNIVLNNINNNENKYKLISQYLNKDNVDFYLMNLFKYMNKIYQLELIIQDDEHIIINNIYEIYKFVSKNLKNKDFCYHKKQILKIHPLGQEFVDAIQYLIDGTSIASLKKYIKKNKIQKIKLENEYPKDDIYIKKFNEIIKDIKIKDISKGKIKLSYQYDKLNLAKYIHKNILQLFKINECFNLYLFDLELFYLDITNKIYKLK